MPVAVLYQACEPPIVNGVKKPMKPNGYRDSGADIACVLKSSNVEVVTPENEPDPQRDEDWCFADTESGILKALEKGATILWANTVLSSSHPLQISPALDKYARDVKVVGQPPQLVEQYDDKNYVNSLLRSKNAFTMPRSWTIDSSSNLDLCTLPYPIVGKPIRGRGSYGVKVCRTSDNLKAHLSALFRESPVMLLEEYLAGEEGTVTVMPPSTEKPRHWAMPIVVRFNHVDGVAPYTGTVAVTSNSRALSNAEFEKNPHYATIARQCEEIAALLRVTAPIRVDIRCFEEGTEFVAFDVNMKPNMTGPGRPGREDQASLTALSAAALGWDYARLLKEILGSASILHDLRNTSIPMAT